MLNSQISDNIDNDIKEFKQIFNIGFELFEKINLDEIKNQKVENIVLSLYSLCNQYDDFYRFLPQYDESLYEKDYYKKIYYDLMIYLQNKFYEDILTCLDDKELCMNNIYRKELLEDYNKLLNIYIKCRDFFDFQMSLDENNFDCDVKSSFLFSKTGDLSFFEKDLKVIPKEYYDRIEKLLYNKRYGYLKPCEDIQLINAKNFRGYRELRNDQIRILYKNMPKNRIFIYGVGVKKCDNDRNMYKKLTGRPCNYNSVDDDSLTYKRILSYININKRKGNR